MVGSITDYGQGLRAGNRPVLDPRFPNYTQKAKSGRGGTNLRGDTQEVSKEGS